MIRLDEEQFDALLEIFSIGIGQAAATLNDFVDSPVRLELPSLRLCRAADLAEALPDLAGKKLVMVSMAFDGPFKGSSGLIIPEQDALDLVTALVGERADATLLDEMRVGALIEVGNIVLNGILGAIANAMGRHLECSVPEFVEDTLENLFFEADGSPDTEVLIAGATVRVDQLRINTEIVLVLEMSTAEQLARALSGQLTCG